MEEPLNYLGYLEGLQEISSLYSGLQDINDHIDFLSEELRKTRKRRCETYIITNQGVKCPKNSRYERETREKDQYEDEDEDEEKDDDGKEPSFLDHLNWFTIRGGKIVFCDGEKFIVTLPTKK